MNRSDTTYECTLIHAYIDISMLKYIMKYSILLKRDTLAVFSMMVANIMSINHNLGKSQ